MHEFQKGMHSFCTSNKKVFKQKSVRCRDGCGKQIIHIQVWILLQLVPYIVTNNCPYYK